MADSGAVRQARYKRTAKGRATDAHYNASDKGRARGLRYSRSRRRLDLDSIRNANRTIERLTRTREGAHDQAD